MLNWLKKILSGGTDLKEILERNAMVVDVRSAGEFGRGHAKGSINIPLSDLNHKIKKLKKKQVPIITCCASGRRSGVAAKRMKELGIEAYNGGSWQKVQRYL